MVSNKRYTVYGIVNGQYQDLTINETLKLFACARDFVASTARGTRKARIMRTSLGDVKSYGILKRLTVRYLPPVAGTSPMYQTDYCCGQEWNSEMAVLRDIFDPKR